MKQIGLKWPEDLIERIDAVLPEGISRSEFIRRCVLVALSSQEPDPVPSLEETEKTYERARVIKSVEQEIPTTATCRCGHTAIRHYQRTGACTMCRECRGFVLPG